MRHFLFVKMKPFLRLLVLYALVGISQAATTFTYIVSDAQGSPVVAMTQTGDVLWRKTYEPYGKSAGNDSGNRVGYTGHIEDQADLVYAKARYYDPVLGRFLSDDPSRFSEKNLMSFNRYAYANNNPYKYVDPDGQDTVSVSTNIQVPSFIMQKLNGMEGMSGLHSGVAVEFPGVFGGEFDAGGYFGADFANNVGLGKVTLNLNYDKGGIGELKKTSGEASALLGRGELGVSIDPDTGDLQGGHVGVGLAPGNAIKFVQSLAKGNKLIKAYTSNMISAGVSVNVQAGSIKKGDIKDSSN